MKGFLLKKARTAEVPTRLGTCEVCHNNGEVRYMAAAKLPRYLYAYMQNIDALDVFQKKHPKLYLKRVKGRKILFLTSELRQRAR